MNQPILTCELLQHRQLSAGTFELVLSRPPDFTFEPGQRIRIGDRPEERDYSLANAPRDSSLRLCIRRVPSGEVSNRLLAAAVGSCLTFTGPHGFFVFRPSPRPAVFVATGTGAAPFAAMARAGTRRFTLLHGVRSADELFYTDLFQTAAGVYAPCISGKQPPAKRIFSGRVTAYVERELPSGVYDFYLCGRREMVRDVTWLIDEHFPDSRVYTEIFF